MQQVQFMETKYGILLTSTTELSLALWVVFTSLFLRTLCPLLRCVAVIFTFPSLHAL